MSSEVLADEGLCTYTLFALKDGTMEGKGEITRRDTCTRSWC